MSVEEAPAPPEAHPAFSDPAAAAAVAVQGKTKSQPEQDVASSGLLSSIDQKLKSQGFEPSKLEAPPSPGQTQQPPPQEQVKKVELQPKVAVEKGPLFLSPTEIPTQGKTPSVEAAPNSEKKPEATEKQPAPGFPRTLVKGPAQSQPVAKTAGQKQPSSEQEEDFKGALEKLKNDMDSVGKVLNPFSW